MIYECYWWGTLLLDTFIQLEKVQDKFRIIVRQLLTTPRSFFRDLPQRLYSNHYNSNNNNRRQNCDINVDTSSTMSAAAASMPAKNRKTIRFRRRSSIAKSTSFRNMKASTAFNTSTTSEHDIDEASKSSRALEKMLRLSGASSRTDKTFVSLDSSELAEGTHSLSRFFPISNNQDSYVLRTDRNVTTIQASSSGVIVSTIEPSAQFPERRLLKDADGRVCAMILRNQEKDGPHSFTICGSKPSFKGQNMSYDRYGKSFFRWAEVRNLGGFGGKFALEGPRDKANKPTFVTKPFGSLFRLKKTRGHVVLNQKQRECARILSVKAGKGVLIGPNQDSGLMLCYAAIVDEMIEQRLR